MVRNGLLSWEFAKVTRERPNLNAKCIQILHNFGGILLGLLMLANSILEPGGPKPSVVVATPKVIVKYDPRASLVERMRNDEAARDTAAKGETLPPPVEPMVPVAQSADHVAKAEAVQVAAPAAVTRATEDANARSVRLAKKKAERVRRQRLARERARGVQQAASQQQSQPYYGYAPQPTYGPFAGWWADRVRLSWASQQLGPPQCDQALSFVALPIQNARKVKLPTRKGRVQRGRNHCGCLNASKWNERQRPKAASCLHQVVTLLRQRAFGVAPPIRWLPAPAHSDAYSQSG
jgi:hypothetical protein